MRTLVQISWVLALVVGVGLAWWRPEVAYGAGMLIAMIAFILDLMTAPVEEE